MMDRRRFIVTASFVFLPPPVAGKAQQGSKVPRIGILAPTPDEQGPVAFQVFGQELKSRGYVEDQTVRPVPTRRGLYVGQNPEGCQACRPARWRVCPAEEFGSISSMPRSGISASPCRPWSGWGATSALMPRRPTSGPLSPPSPRGDIGRRPTPILPERWFSSTPGGRS